MINALILLTLIGASPLSLESLTLQVDGRIIDLQSHDLDGDTHPELVVSYNRGFLPNLERRLAVFCGQADGGFDTSPAIDEPAPKDAILLDLGTVNETPMLCTETGTEVRCRALEPACIGWMAPITIDIAPTLFHNPEIDDLPFALLLSRPLKRSARSLAVVAGLMLAMQLVDLYWLIGPDLLTQGHGHAPLRLDWTELAAVLGLGGLWLFLFARQARVRAVLPLGEPAVRELLQTRVSAEDGVEVASS